MITRIEPHPLFSDTRKVYGEYDDLLGHLTPEGFQPTRNKVIVFSRQDLACLLRYMPDETPALRGGPSPLHSSPGAAQ